MAKIDLEKLICSLAERNIFLRDALKEQGLEYKDGDIVEIPKPKFKVGDWVVLKNGGYFSSGSKTVRIKDIIGKEIGFEMGTWAFEDEVRLWTIEDAKDGDVLCGYLEADYPWIGIFHKLNVDGTFNSYCYLQAGLHGKFCPPSGENIFGKRNVDNHSSSYVVPATRKQRALLFQKMKEAGYEWDADKKKLNKIEEGKASFANRQLYNRAILTILSNYVEKYPDIRFGQMLCNLGIGPVFNEESRETYCNFNETINKSKDESKN